MALQDAASASETNSSDQPWQYEAIDEARNKISDGMEGLGRLSSRASSVRDGSPGINVDSVKDIIDNASRLASKPEYALDDLNDDGPVDCELTPAQRIIHDPESGIAWLALAKSLAMELLSFSDSKKKKVVKEVMDSATRAGDCAARILSDQVSAAPTVRGAPHVTATRSDSEEEAVVSMGVVHDIVDARDVSEALALPYWLETVQMELLTIDETANEQESTKRAVMLQKALVMDPSNGFARQALQRSTPSS